MAWKSDILLCQRIIKEQKKLWEDEYLKMWDTVYALYLSRWYEQYLHRLVLVEFSQRYVMYTLFLILFFS